MNSKLIQSMFKHKVWYGVLLALIVAGLVFGAVLADDGQVFRRNISKTPAGETEKAAMTMLGFYVPAQTSDGELTTVEYYDANDVLVDTREYAKPLVSVYIDGIEEEHEETMMNAQGGVSFGRRDAFAALSLDDGSTWKRDNLSHTADLSSFNLANGVAYPGDVHYMVFAAAGDRVLAGWLSKYCDGGTPSYTLTDEEKAALVTAHPELDDGNPDTASLYLDDLFTVAGSQRSVDYTLQGFPEVGEVPYSCVWTARGKLVEVDAEGVPTEDGGFYEILWTKAERLTSGRRDANRLEISGEPNAGFMMVWQEDPEGLRPGQGLGPGEGWSGAIVNQKTDIWYSYIDWDNFDLVFETEATETTPAVETTLDEFTGESMPKFAVPMAMPTRLSDNNMCKGTPQKDDTGAIIDPYCYGDFDIDAQSVTMYDGPTPEADLCTETVSWTNPGGSTLEICKTADGRVLQGRTGSSRPRINLQGYDQDGDGKYDSAWVILAYEELKALGEGGTSEIEEEVDPIDIGKNVWYHSFDMFKPEMVTQGGQINPPAKDPATGAFFDLITDDFENEFYETEIARRFNLMTNTVAQTADSTSLTSGILIYKMGIINQGGPADIFLRRLVAPDGFNPAEDNPYAFENMACDEWLYTDGSNPRYVEGLCISPGINVSATTIEECDIVSADACAAAFPYDGGETYPKVLKWTQTPDNLDDESWENPYDVAKGHRGFIDGDIIMMMYAWAPNWKANTVGNDHYNLYVRRSFDGGLTWTTTPASLGGDGITVEDRHCEYYGRQDAIEEVCTPYAAGEFEPAWNVSQLIGNKITVLDPRYTPSGGPREFATISTTYDDSVTLTEPYADDVRDPSKYFIIYETGDNTTVAEGEAVPLDLYYSRAMEYGDKYDWEEYVTTSDGETKYRWMALENKLEDLSGEASVSASPGGGFFYAVWNQWREDEHETIYDSDIWYRRVMFLDDTEADPTATILFVSHYLFCETYETLTFVGTAKDNDQIGDDITAYKWRSSIDGDLSDQKQFSMPGWALTPGWHTISFSARDGEGHWSREASINLLVAETISKVNLPLVIGP